MASEADQAEGVLVAVVAILEQEVPGQVPRVLPVVVILELEEGPGQVLLEHLEGAWELSL